MTTDDYKVLIKSKDVLDRGTLNVTIEELERIGESRLTQEIKRIITDNKIEKPTNHNKQNDLTRREAINIIFVQRLDFPRGVGQVVGAASEGHYCGNTDVGGKLPTEKKVTIKV
jgi:hypothetical protein